jgi:hypothetical protein
MTLVGDAIDFNTSEGRIRPVVGVDDATETVEEEREEEEEEEKDEENEEEEEDGEVTRHESKMGAVVEASGTKSPSFCLFTVVPFSLTPSVWLSVSRCRLEESIASAVAYETISIAVQENFYNGMFVRPQVQKVLVVRTWSTK